MYPEPAAIAPIEITSRPIANASTAASLSHDQQQPGERRVLMAQAIRRSVRPVSTVRTAAPLEPNTAYPRSMSTITADVVSHASAQPPALTAVQTARRAAAAWTARRRPARR